MLPARGPEDCAQTEAAGGSSAVSGGHRGSGTSEAPSGDAKSGGSWSLSPMSPQFWLRARQPALGTGRWLPAPRPGERPLEAPREPPLSPEPQTRGFPDEVGQVIHFGGLLDIGGHGKNICHVFPIPHPF